MSAKKQKKKSITVRLLCLGVSVYMVITLTGLLSDLGDSKKKLADLNDKYDSEKIEIEELKALLKDGSQSAVIEKAARERLGYVYSDEQIFVDISGS